jgi:hypothetical protein
VAVIALPAPFASQTSEYVAHSIHRRERAWAETNCYVDLWVEVVHTLGFDPHAALAFTLSADFEGDQWTFFKPPLGDLLELYGIDVQELAVWRPFADHVVEQVKLGRLVISEADAFYLPDTAGTDYRQAHRKTTIGIAAIDLEAQRLGYFHNTAFYWLEGDDFMGALQAHVSMPLYSEFARLDRLKRHSPGALRALALTQARAHLQRRPAENPLARFAKRFTDDLRWLTQGDLATWHTYAFVTLRQVGACAEIASVFLRWLELEAATTAATQYEIISTTAKTLILKGARAVNGRRTVDFTEALTLMSDAWARAMQALQPLAD